MKLYISLPFLYGLIEMKFKMLNGIDSKIGFF